MNFEVLDGVVVAVVLISALLAMFRGFVREVLSIAAWVAAAVLAYLFYEQLVPYVSEYINNPTLAIGASAAAIFLVSLLVVSLITMRISDFVMDSPVGMIDRLLGFLFGAARGVLLIVVAVIFFNWLVDEENRPAWVTSAMTYPELSRLGDQLLAAIPDDPEAAIRGVVEDTNEALQNDSTTPAAPAAPAPTAPTAPTPDVTAPAAPGNTVTPQNQNGLDQLIDGATPASPATPAPATGGTN
ncbi:MAG: hypothetical protein AcusKO_14070 [Acuticoccus sp.]